MKVISIKSAEIDGLKTQIIKVWADRGPVEIDGHQFRVGERGAVSLVELVRRVEAAPYGLSYRSRPAGVGVFEQTLVA